MKYDYDVIILGSGPAGFSCAMQSSKFDKKALIIEADDDHLGGSWINAGTIPSKALRETARIIQRYQNQFPDKAKVKPYVNYEMDDLLTYKNHILAGKNRKLEVDLKKNEIDTFHGFASIIDKNTVEATTKDGTKKTFTAEHILLATGSYPKPPVGFEVDHDKVIDYSSILSLSHIPRRLVIIGSGVNALEYATVFASLGTRVTILNETETFLPWLDHEITEQLQLVLEEKKIEVLKKVKDISIKENSLRNTTEVHYSFKDDVEKGREYVLEIEHALYLGAKVPNTNNLGLKNVGIDLDKEAFIPVDKDMRTSVPNIYAAGDIIGFPRLASVSFSQGRIAACRMFGINSEDLPELIPFGIYSIPEISNIGLTEKEAIAKGLDVTVGRTYYKNITQGDISNQQTGLLKIVFETESLKLVGIHILGERASDLIHLGQAVMNLGGDVRYFVNHVLNYPTYSEAYRIAAFNGLNRVNKAGVKYKNLLQK
ncbi:MAG: Si-specific NAD(P)(+) transhydrogenase [Balneolaceae bacterium]